METGNTFFQTLNWLVVGQVLLLESYTIISNVLTSAVKFTKTLAGPQYPNASTGTIHPPVFGVSMVNEEDWEEYEREWTGRSMSESVLGGV
jgi:hypothetical protein